MKKILALLSVVAGLTMGSSALAQVCGDGGQLGRDVDGVTLVCSGGTSGYYRYGGNIYDGVGPPRNNSDSGSTSDSPGRNNDRPTRVVVQDAWGAVAIDSGTGSYGYSSRMSTRDEAEQAALDDCGRGGCKVFSNFKNSCGALAWGPKSVGSYSVFRWHTNNPKAAENSALSVCKKSAKNCQILVSECSKL